MEDKLIDWDNMSNANIKMRLEELMHQQKSIKDKIISLSEKLESVEKEYFYGNKILIKRYKGEE
jgi:vacuolar-type H+-ATPase subunit E/Vma4